jgi:predicted TIM-barrel fold metal-dependent hydrolase
MRTITLEEHFVTESFLRATNENGHGFPPQLAQMQSKLLDLGAGRIAAMDEAAIDLQVLSLAALGFDELDAATATPLARDINDELAQATRTHPTRFAGFAALALKDPSAAAAELERCVTRHGFVGAMLDGTTGGLFLDDARFLPVFEAASHLGVPVYLHPAPPPETVKQAYFSGLPGELGFMLSIAGWGWHAETGLHTLRLIVSGLFDRLPNLQWIIGHMGEGIPYALARSSGMLSAGAPHLRQPVAAYFQSNIHITTSGYFTQPPLRCAMDVVGIDRLLFSVDYPFSANTRGRQYLDSLAETLSEPDLSALAHGNADRLLKLAFSQSKG